MYMIVANTRPPTAITSAHRRHGVLAVRVRSARGHNTTTLQSQWRRHAQVDDDRDDVAGAGIQTRVMFKVYVGSLYVPAKTNNLAGVLAKEPRRIQLDILRNLSADQLIDALTDGIKENSSAEELAAIKPQVDQMVATMKSFNEGNQKDVVTLDFVDGATRIGLNGSAKGSIPGEPFNRVLTRIWLGDKPVQTDLKQAMLEA